MFKSGYVAIVGSPNAGKSTLLNNILDYKVAITSDKANTTRNMIRGIYTDDASQIVFVDTPGITKPQNKLQVFMKNQTEEAMASVDVILYMLDANIGIRKKENEIIEKLSKRKDIKIIACLNKIDLIEQEKAMTLIGKLKDFNIFDDIIAISLKDKIEIKGIIDMISGYLDAGELLYTDSELVDFTTSFYISEVIREKAIRLTEEELPHSIYTEIKEIDDKNSKVYIEAVIYVERESQKGIVIGKKAQMIKKIGEYARTDIERYYQKQVYLELIVRVNKKWTNNNLDFFEEK